MMHATPGEALVITLGWDLDAFWSAVERAPMTVLEEAHAILSAPDLTKPDDIEVPANGADDFEQLPLEPEL